MKRSFDASQRESLFALAGGKCVGCGLALEPGWHADHVHPWTLGGKTEIANGQALCPGCNRSKGNRGARDGSIADAVLSATEARGQLGRLVDQAHFRDEAAVIVRNEQPRAAIISAKRFAELVEVASPPVRKRQPSGAAGADAGADLDPQPSDTIRRRVGGSGA